MAPGIASTPPVQRSIADPLASASCLCLKASAFCSAVLFLQAAFASGPCPSWGVAGAGVRAGLAVPSWLRPGVPGLCPPAADGCGVMGAGLPGAAPRLPVPLGASLA
eukprot:16439714-Heterocapsa_arctica.AAC.1